MMHNKPFHLKDDYYLDLAKSHCTYYAEHHTKGALFFADSKGKRVLDEKIKLELEQIALEKGIINKSKK